MKLLLRGAFRLLILLVMLLVAALLLLNTAVRKIAEYQLSKKSGLKIKIGSVDVGWKSPYFSASNLVIYSRAEFGGAPMIELPELEVQYDREALKTHQLHCTLVRLNLASINIIEDKSGRKNIEDLPGYARFLAPTNAGGRSLATFMGVKLTRIDNLNLTLGKATYRRFQSQDKIEELSLNVKHQQFSHIENEQDLRSALLVALLRSGVNLMQSDNSQVWLHILAPTKNYPGSSDGKTELGNQELRKK
jgi:uncharacterized protein involved in outer membrane biogenesis